MIKDVVGLRFGNLEVIKYHDTINHRKYYECKCDCGNVAIVAGSFLRNGTTNSCGCLRGKKIRNIDVRQEAIEEPYGKSRTTLYGMWTGMKGRCLNPNNYSYYKYGGRGISICEEWMDYDIFKEWALNNGYGNNLSLDRIDNDGNYEPDNCRWVDMKTQSNNTRRNRIIKYKGMEKTLAEWSDYFGVTYNLLTVAHAKGKSYKEIMKYYDPTT